MRFDGRGPAARLMATGKLRQTCSTYKKENKDEKAKSDKGGSPDAKATCGESAKSPNKANGAEAAGGEQQQGPNSVGKFFLSFDL